MMNQVILIGRVVSFHDDTVDNGTHALFVTLVTESGTSRTEVEVRFAGDIVTHVKEHTHVNRLMAVKGRLFKAVDGLVVIGERVTVLNS